MALASSKAGEANVMSLDALSYSAVMTSCPTRTTISSRKPLIANCSNTFAAGPQLIRTREPPLASTEVGERSMRSDRRN